MQKILRWFLIVLMFPALSAGLPASAKLESPQVIQATVTVDTLTDNYDLTDNKCSLREALDRAWIGVATGLKSNRATATADGAAITRVIQIMRQALGHIGAKDTVRDMKAVRLRHDRAALTIRHVAGKFGTGDGQHPCAANRATILGALA